MSGSAIVESSLDILSRAAFAAGIMAEKAKYDTKNLPSLLRPDYNSEDSEDDLNEEGREPGLRPAISAGREDSLVINSEPLYGTLSRRSIIAYANSDVPVDMSLKKSKRKWSSIDLGGCRDGEEDCENKRKRPSVITCSNRKLCVSCDSTDVDDHFRKSLGLESYNWIFHQAKRMLPGTSNDNIGIGGKKASSGTSGTCKTLLKGKKTEIPASLKVDEHFAKSLGKSTWMRLQGL